MFRLKKCLLVSCLLAMLPLTSFAQMWEHSLDLYFHPQNGKIEKVHLQMETALNKKKQKIVRFKACLRIFTSEHNNCPILGKDTGYLFSSIVPRLVPSLETLEENNEIFQELQEDKESDQYYDNLLLAGLGLGVLSGGALAFLVEDKWTMMLATIPFGSMLGTALGSVVNTTFFQTEAQSRLNDLSLIYLPEKKRLHFYFITLEGFTGLLNEIKE